METEAVWVFIAIAAVIVVLFVSSLAASCLPYRPNRGLKFRPPPADLYPFVHRWMTFGLDSSGEVIDCSLVADPKKTSLACLHYIDEYTGPVGSDPEFTMIMFHGNPTWSFLYRKMVLKLRQRYRCIAVDYPGFGLSTAPENYAFQCAQHRDVVLKLAELLRLENLIIVGQDWGGPISMSFAVHASRDLGIKIRGFAEGNTLAGPVTETFPRCISLICGSCCGRSLQTGCGCFQAMAWSFFTPSLDSYVLQWYKKPFENKRSRTGVWVFPKEILASPILKEINENLGPMFGSKGVPMMFFMGLQDKAIAAEPLKEKFGEMFDDFEHFWMPDAGHFWQEDKGDLAADKILDWMQRKFHGDEDDGIVDIQHEDEEELKIQAE